MIYSIYDALDTCNKSNATNPNPNPNPNSCICNPNPNSVATHVSDTSLYDYTDLTLTLTLTLTLKCIWYIIIWLYWMVNMMPLIGVTLTLVGRSTWCLCLTVRQGNNNPNLNPNSNLCPKPSPTDGLNWPPGSRVLVRIVLVDWSRVGRLCCADPWSLQSPS